MAFTLKRKSAKLTASGYLKASVGGLWTAALLCVGCMLSLNMGWDKNLPHSLAQDILLFVGMIAAAWMYRRSQESLSMRQAYLFCSCLGFVAVTIYAVFIYLYSSYVAPEMVTQYLEHKEQLLYAASEMTDIEKAEQLRILRTLDPLRLASLTYMQMLLVAVFIPLFFSLFLKNEKNSHVPQK